MKNRNTIFLLLLLCMTLCGCASMQDDVPKEKTSIDIQAMQIRQFDCSFKDAFASVIDVFQDQGFVIQTSDLNTGLIVARGSTKDVAHSTHTSNSWYSGEKLVDKSSCLVGTVRVEEVMTDTSSIRLSFVDEISETFVYSSPDYGGFGERIGGSRVKNSRKFIEDERFYSNFFEKIDKSIFVRKNLKGHERAL